MASFAQFFSLLSTDTHLDNEDAFWISKDRCTNVFHDFSFLSFFLLFCVAGTVQSEVKENCTEEMIKEMCSIFYTAECSVKTVSIVVYSVSRL